MPISVTCTRRSLAAALAVVAAAIVFSPLVAALTGTGLKWPSVADAFRHVGRPLAGSVGAAVGGAVVAMLLGFPFAIAVDRAGPWVRRACWGCALATLIVPPYVVAESAIVLLGPAGKMSRGLALRLGMGPPATDVVGRARYAVPGFVFTRSAVGCVLGGCFFPIVALAVAGANRRTDRRVFESARLIRGGRGVASVAAHVLVPPAVGAGLLVFAASLTESVVPQLLRVRTVGEAINDRVQDGDLATAAALSLPLLPAIVAAGAAGAWVLVRARAASLAGLEGEVPTFTGGHGGRAVGAGAAAVTGLAVLPGLVLPAVSLAWLALATPVLPSMGGGHRVLRASGFGEALAGAWALVRDDAIRTAMLAAVTATVSVAFAVALVWPLVRNRWGTLLGGLGAGLAVPAPIVGLGLIVLWNRGPTTAVYHSLAIVVLCWLARFLPIGVLLSQVALARVPRELEEAAALAGRGAMGRLASVVLPAAAPGLAAAWVATYVLCATEYAATLLVAPAGSPMLAPSVVNLMRRGQDPEIAAVQVLLLAVVAAPLVVIGVGLLCRRAWASVRPIEAPDVHPGLRRAR
jgi:iron(III) transport system permease protein